jgi:two-component system chemotaxis response regulator CheB
MNRIRVLIVDDSVAIRSVLRQMISSEPDLEVAGVAANGKIAVEMLDQVSPDLVTLDIEMPEMDGLQTLSAIRETHPHLPVVMFSTLTERAAVATLQALALGASDYVTKPANARPGQGLHVIREQLMPKIRVLCRKERILLPVARPSSAPFAEITAIAIGASTGGPNALSAVLPLLPSSLPVPVFVVQHMPPIFTRFLAERLDRECKLPVRELTDGDLVVPGQVSIAPGDYHMTLQKEAAAVRLRTTQSVPENSCRPSVDVLFRSVACVYGSGALAVILTGMGQDGFRGCQAIREHGGTVLAQDEASSVVWGMPGYVANAGLAHRVLPLDQIAGEISRRVAARVTRPAGVPA